MNIPNESNEFSSFCKEIEKALFNAGVLRNHLTIEIKTPDTWIQKYTVVYRNEKDSLDYIRLAPRRKVVQRNLSVYDRKDHRLTIIPSELVCRALINICETYLSQAEESAENIQNVYLYELTQECINFCDVFSYDSNPESIQEILNKLKKVMDKFDSESKRSTTCFIYLKRIYFLVSIYKNFYIPIVKLEKPLRTYDWLLISYSVENLPKPSINKDHMKERSKNRTSMSNRALYFAGYLDLSFPVELETNASNHVRILSPPGMMFRRAGISGLEDVLHLHEKYGDLWNFLDDDMVYFHIPQEDSKKITELQETKTKTSSGKDKIKIETKIGIDKGFSRRFSLIRSLVLLMYTLALIPLWAFFFPYEDFIFGFRLISTSVLITLAVLVSLAVYSMDKRFLHDYLAGQVIILIVFYVIELLIIIPFW